MSLDFRCETLAEVHQRPIIAGPGVQLFGGGGYDRGVNMDGLIGHARQ